MNDTSQFRMISIGYVAENKLRTTNEVEVSLTELRPFINGELVAGVKEETVECVDSFGRALSFKVKTSNTIRATWLGEGTNRISSPDVRRSEQVHLYQYGNTDKYYWKAVTMPGSNTRKLETVITAYSNTTDETQNAMTPETAWSEEVNTHDGHWTRQTNKSNGEPFAYTQQINAKGGNVTVIADDAGAHQSLDSNEDKHIIEAAGGAKIEVVNNEVIITCQKLTVKASGEIHTITPKATHDDKVVTFNGNEFNVKVGKVTYNSSKYAINGGSFTHNGTNVGSTHFHIGNLGRPVSPPR